MSLEEFLLKDVKIGESFLMDVRTYDCLLTVNDMSNASNYKDIICDRYQVSKELVTDALEFLRDNTRVLPEKYKLLY